MVDPMIIMCAPNGARRGKSDHSALPISPVELARCAAEVLEAGAGMLHLHVRAADGSHTLSIDRYQAAISAIRKEVGDQLVLQVTSESVGQYCREEQIAMVKMLRPEAVSLALRELCPDEADIVSTAAFFAWMRQERMFPQIILYDSSDVVRFNRLRREGVFASERPFVLYVVGRYGDQAPANPMEFQGAKKEFDQAQVPWMMCGFGLQEYTLSDYVAENGGHMRVGFENNMWRADGSSAENNTELVCAAHMSAKSSGRMLMPAAVIREQFIE